jgi:hypothetical protein
VWASIKPGQHVLAFEIEERALRTRRPVPSAVEGPDPIDSIRPLRIAIVAFVVMRPSRTLTKVGVDQDQRLGRGFEPAAAP